MWLNRSVATINATLQLLVIYRQINIDKCMVFNHTRGQQIFLKLKQLKGTQKLDSEQLEVKEDNIKEREVRVRDKER